MKETNLLRKYGIGAELKRQKELRTTAKECRNQGNEVICSICQATEYCQKRCDVLKKGYVR